MYSRLFYSCRGDSFVFFPLITGCFCHQLMNLSFNRKKKEKTELFSYQKTLANISHLFFISFTKDNKTRMHSSRMLTGRSLTVCCSLLSREGVSAPRGSAPWGGVSAPGGGGGSALCVYPSMH